MRRQQWIVALGLLVPAAAALAQQEASAVPAAEAAIRPPAGGDATRQWLDRQRRGSQASAKAQALPGPVLDQVYDRYRKSFAHPIPDRFESERLGAGAGR